jgi:hypothetical protein
LFWIASSKNKNGQPTESDWPPIETANQLAPTAA